MSTAPVAVPVGPPAVLARTRWSVLDRAQVRAGQTPAEALRATVDFAREVERLGYHRFWVAEHHAVPGVAGAAPTVLAAAVAAATERVRVGTGGVMLPNHRPLVVAEQFGVLASLHPDRIDMGLGRSVGFTGAVRRALGAEREAMDGFADQLAELLDYFAGRGPVRAVPAQGLDVPAFVLATGAGADIAADLGLPLVLGASADAARTRATAERYRDRFTPRAPGGARPYLVLAVNVAVAETDEAARRRQLPEAWAVAHSRTRGDFPPLQPPAAIAERRPTEREARYLAEALAGQVHGDEVTVVRQLTELVTTTGADEVLVTFATHDPAEQLDSYRRLARLAGL
ncbi:MsnO8 family LLM class oxidoreductase [Streptomyces triticirhizae]|uniref:MsnO8 family LLM class oxidoreductase n=1 Tax=Streptomyces triticirhizae TaxID=2483353 RepID=A0A3M2M3F8_9ACTN|nr:MsnO8 family LLM class oxidoreductase [Streptomyces triticirhizae]RMI44129.1 MsnO8 family LLM class oxidoreductase [Streptomyces triticirhizae]